MPTIHAGRAGNGTKFTGQSQGFRRLLLGSSVSALGSRVTTIAYPMLVLYLTGSPAAAGWVGFAATAPSVVLYIPAGALVDRWKPRPTMLISEVGRGAAIAAVVGAICLGRLHVPLLMILAAIEESLEVFSTLSERRYVRSLVEPGQVSSALVLSEARTHLTVLLGRPLGGILFGLGPVVPFAADLVSFIISAGSLITSRDRRTAWNVVARRGVTVKYLDRSADQEKGAECVAGVSDRRPEIEIRKLWREIWDGIIWIHRERFVRAVLPLAASTTLVAQALIMIFLTTAHERKLTSLAVGIVLAASGVGGTLGSLIGSRIDKHIKCLHGQMSIWVLPFIVLAVLDGQSLFWMAVAIFIFGFTGALSNIELNFYLMSRVGSSMLARILSISQVISFAAFALGAAVGGALAQWCGVSMGIWCLLGLVALLAFISARAFWTSAPVVLFRAVKAVVSALLLAVVFMASHLILYLLVYPLILLTRAILTFTAPRSVTVALRRARGIKRWAATMIPRVLEGSGDPAHCSPEISPMQDTEDLARAEDLAPAEEQIAA